MKTPPAQLLAKLSTKASGLVVSALTTRSGISNTLAGYGAKTAILGPLLESKGSHLLHLLGPLAHPLSQVLAQSEPMAAALVGAAVGVRIPHRAVAESLVALGGGLACVEPSGAALHLLGILMASLGAGGWAGTAGTHLADVRAARKASAPA